MCVCNGKREDVSLLNVFQKCEASDAQSLCTFVILNVNALSELFIVLKKNY